jgi:hypothetical protein
LITGLPVPAGAQEAKKSPAEAGLFLATALFSA